MKEGSTRKPVKELTEIARLKAEKRAFESTRQRG